MFHIYFVFALWAETLNNAYVELNFNKVSKQQPATSVKIELFRRFSFHELWLHHSYFSIEMLP